MFTTQVKVLASLSEISEGSPGTSVTPDNVGRPIRAIRQCHMFSSINPARFDFGTLHTDEDATWWRDTVPSPSETVATIEAFWASVRKHLQYTPAGHIIVMSHPRLLTRLFEHSAPSLRCPAFLTDGKLSGPYALVSSKSGTFSL
jgi:hypothetical protein